MSERARLLGLDDRALERECEVDRYRASGPGGQKRNKTESAVRVRHLATGIMAFADDTRSQHGNRARAVQRLREKLALELRETAAIDGYAPPPALAALLAAGTPTSRRARDHASHLEAIAELLDLVVACEGSVSDAAAALGVTTAALSRLITGETRVLRAVNEIRDARELRPLRTD